MGRGLAEGRRYDRGRDRPVARDARGERTRNTQICAPGQIRQLGSRAARICLSAISQLLRRGWRPREWCMVPSDRFITFSQLSIGLAA